MARPDQARLQDGSADIRVLDNDFDPDGSLDTGSLVVVDGPDHGHVAVNDGVINYLADSSFNGSDQLRYRICDNGNPPACAEANVTITN